MGFSALVNQISETVATHNVISYYITTLCTKPLLRYALMVYVMSRFLHYELILHLLHYEPLLHYDLLPNINNKWLTMLKK